MEENNTPNPEVVVIEDANANPEATPVETVAETTVENPIEEAEPAIDYKKKFSESSKEAQRLLEEKKAAEEELERLRNEKELQANGDLYPGFNDLDEDQRKNLVAYTNSIRESVKKEIYQDPSISFARQSFNEKKWEDAFNKVSSKYPELKDNKDEFKNKYFKVDNVPTNIENILEDVSKIYLFDKAKAIGASEERQKANRIEIERSQGGDKKPTVNRSLSDYQKLADENPAKFAKESKQFNEDLASGRLK
jgi:hypothetical protein